MTMRSLDPLPRLRHVVLGHYLTGAVYGVGVFVVASIGLGLVERSGLIAGCVLPVLCGAALKESIQAPIHYAHCRRAHHPAPGGAGYALGYSALSLAAYTGCAALLAPAPEAISAIALATAIIEITHLFFIRPWQPGLTQAQVRERWEATKKAAEREGLCGD